MKVERFADRTSWLASRRKGIGGSEVAAILGRSRWRTPLQVWASKVGLEPDSAETTYSQERGLHMEPLIERVLEREAGIWVYSSHADDDGGEIIVTHPTYPCLRYSPDGFAIPTGQTGEMAEGGVFPNSALVEFKSRHPAARDEWAEGIPEDVALQVQHGLAVCEMSVAYVACDLVTECRWTRVEKDPAYETESIPRLLEFWKLVEAETPPAPTAEDRDVLGRLYPRPQAGKTVALDATLLELAWELEVIEREGKERERRAEEIKNLVRAAIGDAERGVLPDGGGWSWTVTERKEHVVKASASRVLRRFKAKER